MSFDATLTTNTHVTMVVDSSKSRIGDEMYWMFTSSNQITIPLQYDTFFYTNCGDAGDTMTVSIPNFIGVWIFDGYKWVNTWDNC